jgi:hypothetical protein
MAHRHSMHPIRAGARTSMGRMGLALGRSGGLRAKDLHENRNDLH